jgi:hypothetical protein
MGDLGTLVPGGLVTRLLQHAPQGPTLPSAEKRGKRKG